MRSPSLTWFFHIRQMLPAGMQPVEALPGNRETYGSYIHLALPSGCEMVLISLISMMATVMVSGIGTDAVAAVGLVGQPRMIMLCMFFALNVGITAVVARRRGENRRQAANATVRTAIVICIALSALLMALLIPLATPLMRFAGAEAGRTLEDATDYFIIMGLALPFQALSLALCAAQRGVQACPGPPAHQHDGRDRGRHRHGVGLVGEPAAGGDRHQRFEYRQHEGEHSQVHRPVLPDRPLWPQALTSSRCFPAA